MSINRLLARFAVVTALNNRMKAPWPTIAGPHIFDSKIEPVEDMMHDRAFPACVVYTDYDKDAWSFSKKMHQDRLMTITIEILVVQAEQVPGNGDTYQLECPITDSEIESSLDLFETQVYRALTAGNPASDLFTYLCHAYETVISRRGASVAGAQRLAARQITLELRTLRDFTTGEIPEPVQKFFDYIAEYPDYADRVDDVRQIMEAPKLLNENDRRRLITGHSRYLDDALGKPAQPKVLLPANLTFVGGGTLR